MSDVYVKIRKGKVKRTIDLDGVLIDKGENEEIIGVEILDAREVTLDGKTIKS